MASTSHGNPATHVLQCMDLWSGNESVENSAATPGIELFVFSEPYRGERRGGDIHHVSLCVGGVVTRLVLADVAGHGEAVAEVSHTLRTLVRRFMNSKSQGRLVRDLNREFTRLSQAGRFATAIVATYLSHKRQFTLCNAGHPRPLWFHRATGQWNYVDDQLLETEHASNLPLGLDDATKYQQFQLQVGEGDILVLYTDALTEARGGDDQLLGEAGLLKLMSQLPVDDVQALGRALLQRIRDYSDQRPAEDDLTVLALRFTHRGRTPGVGEKLRAYAKLLGLQPI